MKNKFSLIFIAASIVVMFTLMTSCQKDYVTPAPVQSRSFVEDFDTVANLYTKGWVFNNNSRPQGIATWQQGLYTVGFFGFVGFPAYSYKFSPDEYAFIYYEAGSGTANLSSWMISPPIEMRNGDKISFYARTYPGNTTAPDRLQVRLNVTDGSPDVGFDSSSVGKFTRTLLDINNNLTGSGFPQTWTRYEATISGLPSTLLKRRVAFRYYVPNGGPGGANSLAIGVDQFRFEEQ